MRTIKILLFLLLLSLLSGVMPKAFSKISEEQTYLLPWETVADEFKKGNWFCGDKNLLRNSTLQDPDCNCCYQSNQTIDIKLTSELASIYSKGKIDLNMARYENDSLQSIGRISTIAESDRIIRVSSIKKAGFYQLSGILKTQIGEPDNFQIYVIVCANWKKDILAFCREMKEEIELNPDPQFIRSCIAISHFDHCMELISESPFLSSRILKALVDAIGSKKAFDNGQFPDLVIGLNKIRLKRFEGALIEEFVVYIPKNYMSSKPWAVLLRADNRRWGTKDQYLSHSGLIDIWWHTVPDKDVSLKNYNELMGILKKKINIDEDRIYLNGECGNGIGAMSLALNYPDYWAECSITLGNSYRNLAGNALNLPLIFVKGAHNEDPLIGYYEFAVKCFQYYELMNFKHSQTEDISSVRGKSVPDSVREKWPQRVLYSTESLGYPQSYWVRIEGREDENLVGIIDAYVQGQKVIIETKNIDAYTLNLTKAPLDVKQPIEIIENKVSLGYIENQVFTNKSQKYEGITTIKNERLHGPVWDVFTDPYIIVWGDSSRDKKISQENEKTAKLLATDGLCFSDVNMPENFIDSHNLILVGTIESNLWLQKILPQLPLQIESSKIVTKSGIYEANDTGLILIYPNPMNIHKYIAVFFGTSKKAIEYISKAYALMNSIRPADVGIFEVTNSGTIKWHIVEKFDTTWNWHSDWDRTLTTISKKHPKWQWDQLVAKILREQLQADIAICESFFLFEDSEPLRQISYRNLFNTFRNDWFVKIEINGSNLRKLLMVPFADISKRETDKSIISGVSFIKQRRDFNNDTLMLNELENDKEYTVVISEKCINGQRTGLVLKDYKIVDDGYLVPLLKDYLKKQINLDVDDQLNSFEIKMF